MKLYLTHASPYARAARIALREKGLEDRIAEQESHPFDNAAEFVASNPLGKVPCLVTDDGALMDSEVICAYIDRQLGDGQMSRLMDDNWSLRTYYSVTAGLTDTLVLRRLEKAREQEGLRSDFWWQRYGAAIERTLDYLDTNAHWLPQQLSLAHIALGCALAYLDFRHGDIAWRSGHKTLAELSAQLELRDSFRDTPLHD